MKPIIYSMIISLSLLAGLITSCSHTPPQTGGVLESTDFALWAEEWLQSQLDKTDLQGGVSILVYSRGDLLYSGVSGFSNRETGSLIGPETPMPLGSVSKLFTAIALLQLVEQDLIDLDSPVSIYLPEWQLPGGEEKVITPRMLLTHRSGIQGEIMKDFISRQDIDPDRFQRSFLELSKNLPLVAEPDSRFSYSNAGYALLGILIEEVSGVPFSQYIRNRIFSPAGMTDSLSYAGERPNVLPLGYKGKESFSMPLLRDGAAGNLSVSQRDMQAFLTALYQGKLIEEATFQTMLTVQNRDNPYDRSFEMGLGFWTSNILGTEDQMAYHFGDLHRFHSGLISFPQRESAVFVAVNDQSKQGMLAVEWSKELSRALLSWEEQQPFEDLQSVPLTAEASHIEAPKEMAGIYPTMMGPLELSVTSKGYKINLMGLPMLLKQDDEGFYSPELRFLGIPVNIEMLKQFRFDLYRTKGQSWISLWGFDIYMGSNLRLNQEELMTSVEIPTGSYYLKEESEILQEIKITKKGGIYIMQTRFLDSPLKLYLQPLNPTRALTAGKGRMTGEYLQFSDEGDLLTWSGLTFYRK